MSNVFVPTIEAQVILINTRPFDVKILRDKNGLHEDYLVRKENVIITRAYPAYSNPPQVCVEEDNGLEIFGVPVCNVIYNDGRCYNKIMKFPDEQSGIFYIVSSLVAVAAARLGRNDCLFPGLEVRNIEDPMEVLGYYWLYKA